MGEIRDLFKKQYGSFEESIGIFGKYKSIIQTAEGDIDGLSLIMFLGKKFAENGLISITGEGVFFKDGREVTRCEFLQEEIKKRFLSSEESLTDFSRCLAIIPSSALFLLTAERSSSQKEEEEFLRNRFGTSNLAVGALFLENPKGCDKIAKASDHYLCGNTNFDLCKKYLCPFIYQGNIPAGDMERFVKKEAFKLIIVQSKEALPGIVANIMKRAKN